MSVVTAVTSSVGWPAGTTIEHFALPEQYTPLEVPFETLTDHEPPPPPVIVAQNGSPGVTSRKYVSGVPTDAVSDLVHVVSPLGSGVQGSIDAVSGLAVSRLIVSASVASALSAPSALVVSNNPASPESTALLSSDRAESPLSSAPVSLAPLSLEDVVSVEASSSLHPLQEMQSASVANERMASIDVV